MRQGARPSTNEWVYLGLGCTPPPGATGDPTRDDRYYAVNALGGHVTNYSERFAAGTSLASAEAQAMREFPNDARVLWPATKDACTQMGVTSARLGTALGAGGDGAMVDFTSDTGAYSAGQAPARRSPRVTSALPKKPGAAEQ